MLLFQEPINKRHRQKDYPPGNGCYLCGKILIQIPLRTSWSWACWLLGGSTSWNCNVVSLHPIWQNCSPQRCLWKPKWNHPSFGIVSSIFFISFPIHFLNYSIFWDTYFRCKIWRNIQYGRCLFFTSITFMANCNLFLIVRRIRLVHQTFG